MDDRVPLSSFEGRRPIPSYTPLPPLRRPSLTWPSKLPLPAQWGTPKAETPRRPSFFLRELIEVALLDAHPPFLCVESCGWVQSASNSPAKSNHQRRLPSNAPLRTDVDWILTPLLYTSHSHGPQQHPFRVGVQCGLCGNGTVHGGCPLSRVFLVPDFEAGKG